MTRSASDDRFTWHAADVVLTQCLLCRHLANGPVAACAAFPGAIPAEIMSNDFDHSKPWIDPKTGDPGDRGMALAGSILFEPRAGINPVSLDRLRRHFDAAT